MKRRKPYAYTRDPLTGKRVLAHRLLVEQQLGRPLHPKEVVHHRDGDSLNNDLANLIVLPSQRFHAHAEFHSRRVKTGMAPLFPEYFQAIPQAQGSLFDHVLAFTETGTDSRPVRVPSCQVVLAKGTLPVLLNDSDKSSRQNEPYPKVLLPLPTERRLGSALGLTRAVEQEPTLKMVYEAFETAPDVQFPIDIA